MLVSEALLATRQHLGQVRERLNRTSAPVTPGAVTVVFEFTDPLPAVGSMIEVRSSTASEVMHVWSVNTATKTATVLRAQEGSAELDHASGALVALNPLLTQWDVFQEVRGEIAQLPGEGLYREQEAEITYDYTLDGYNVSNVTDYLGPLAVVLSIGGRDTWAYDFLTEPHLLRLPNRPVADDNLATLFYRSTFSEPGGYSTDLSTLGIPASAHDIVGIGAALRLVYSREQLRSQVAVQTHARKAEDVPPGAGARSVQLLHEWKQNRLSTETRRLRERFPRRRN